MKDERTRISVQILSEDYEWLKKYAERERVSLSDVVRRAIAWMIVEGTPKKHK